MTCGLVHTSCSLPEWQSVKQTFFAPAQIGRANLSLAAQLKNQLALS